MFNSDFWAVSGEKFVSSQFNRFDGRPQSVAGNVPESGCEKCDHDSGDRRYQNAPLIGYRREPVSKIEEYVVIAAIFGGLGYLAYLAFKDVTR